MQSIDHRYNIRGWLTKINEADVTYAASGHPGFDYFGMELAYDNSVSGLSTTPMYNGNISAIHWSKGNGGSVGKQAYTFTYDPMNRLEEASHFDYFGLAWESFEKSYQEKIHEYDLNGNIKKLSRRTFGGALMDSLSYGYTGSTRGALIVNNSLHKMPAHACQIDHVDFFSVSLLLRRADPDTKRFR